MNEKQKQMRGESENAEKKEQQQLCCVCTGKSRRKFSLMQLRKARSHFSLFLAHFE